MDRSSRCFGGANPHSNPTQQHAPVATPALSLCILAGTCHGGAAPASASATCSASKRSACRSETGRIQRGIPDFEANPTPTARHLAAEASTWPSWRPKATPPPIPFLSSPPSGRHFSGWRPSLLARLGEVHRGEVTPRLHRLPHLGQPTPDSGDGMGVKRGGGSVCRALPRRGRCQGELTEAAQAKCPPRITAPLCLRGVRQC